MIFEIVLPRCVREFESLNITKNVINYDTLKKVSRFVFSFPAGMSLAWTGIIKLFPASKSLISDIRAGEGKTGNLFCSVVTRDSPFMNGNLICDCNSFISRVQAGQRKVIEHREIR